MWEEEFDEAVEGLTREEKKKFASESMELFFEGRIPQEQLLTDENLNTVLDTPLIEAVESVHSLIPDGFVDKRRSSKRDRLPKSTETIISIMNRCAQLYIPKPFAPGIMMLHFQYCEDRIE